MTRIAGCSDPRGRHGQDLRDSTRRGSLGPRERRARPGNQEPSRFLRPGLERVPRNALLQSVPRILAKRVRNIREASLEILGAGTDSDATSRGGGGFEETKRPHPSTTAGGRLRRHLPRGSRFCRGRSWRRAFGPRRSCVRRTDRRHGATHTAGVHSRRRAWLRRRRQCATE